MTCTISSQLSGFLLSISLQNAENGKAKPEPVAGSIPTISVESELDTVCILRCYLVLHYFAYLLLPLHALNIDSVFLLVVIKTIGPKSFGI